MIDLLLGALALALSGFDAWLTRHRMIAYGPEVELNPVIRWFGPRWGGFFGLMSNLAALVLLFHFNLSRGLAFWAGLKSGLFALQLRSLSHEHEVASSAAA